MTRANVDEVDIEFVDLGDELRQGIELRFDLAPVVVSAPIADQLLQFCELHALRPVVDRLLVRPSRGGDAPAQVENGLFGNTNGEGAEHGALVGFVRRDR